MEREQTTYGEVIGSDDGEIIVLDYTFDHGDGFRGATGSGFRAISKAELEEARDMDSLKERFEEIWREDVHAGNTELGLEDYCESILQCDGDDALFDFSYAGCWDAIRAAFPEYANEEEYPYFECIGGGRMFEHGKPPTNLLRPDLWAIIESFEAPKAA